MTVEKFDHFVPPQQLDAEANVLGAILLRNEALDVVADLAPGDFYDPKHGSVFGAMLTLRASMTPADAITIAAELDRIGKGQALGGAIAFLSHLVSQVGTADNIRFYADLVFEASGKRQLLHALADASAAVLGGRYDLDDCLDVAWQKLSGVAQRQPDTTRPVGDWIRATISEVDEALQRKERGESPLTGLPTGFDELDRLTGGLEPGQLSIVAARPRAGKSSLCRSIADNASERGVGVHVISLEDTGKVYARRVLADRARLDLRKLRTLEAITRPDLSGLYVAADKLCAPPRPWILDDARSLSSAQIAARVRRHARENKTQIVIVDYVQMIHEPTVRRNADPREHIDAAINGLNRLAGEGYHVILVAQLNRESEKRAGGRPMLADLKETGKLEESARTVILVWRPELHEQDDERKLELAGRAYLVVAKHSNGPEGTVELHFDAPTATFRPLSRRQLDPIAERYA